MVLKIIFFCFDFILLHLYLREVNGASYYTRKTAIMALNLTGFMFLTSYLLKDNPIFLTLANFLKSIPHPLTIILFSSVSLLFIGLSENYGRRVSLSLVSGFLLICSAEGQALLIYSTILYIFLMVVVMVIGIMNISLYN